MSAVEPINERTMTRPERDALILKLRAEGHTLAAIAKLVHVSEQRVHQIVHRGKGPTP